jgi:uncharacterized protein
MQRLGLSVTLLACSLLVLTACPPRVRAQQSATPPSEYKKVSALVPLPDFLPGLGTLYVKPDTLPAGPFLAYDRTGKLVSSVYMIPLKDLETHKAFNDLAVAHEQVDHVDLYYNAGHPGVPEPHYHIVLWYVSPQQEAALK